MKKSLLIVLLLIVSLCIVVSCKEPESEQKKAKLKSLNLTGAKSFILVPTAGQGAKDVDKDKLVLCKMKADGSVEEVAAQNDEGIAYHYVPEQFFDAGQYIITRDSDGGVYLISKSDGTAYDMNEIGVPVIFRNNLGDSGNGSYEGRKSVFLDSQNRIYFVANSRVVRIDATDPEHVVAQFLTADQYRLSEVHEFCVSKNGDVLFSASVNDSPISGEKLYLYKGVQGSTAIVSEHCRCLSFTGYDGEIYLQYIEPGPEGYQDDPMTLKKLAVNESGEISYTTIGTTGLTSWYSGGYQWLYLAQMIIVLGNANGQCPGVECIIYDNNTHTVSSSIRDSLTTGTNVDIVGDVDRYFIAKGNGSILKVDPVNSTVETLLEAGTYDIGKLSPSGGYLAFSGVRLSDSKKVLGSINTNDGTVTIENDNLDGNILVLQKIEMGE
ncbi:MAG: hypothetical protein IKP61_02110 [Spirochaetales bacterium]|nr:hypothetical protein [Spirochaetales bacterium]